MYSEAKFQIGKSGLTEGVIEALKLVFKTHKRIRISVLKSSGRDRNSIRELADELCEKMPDLNCDYKILGFTIILIRHASKPIKKFNQKLKYPQH